MSSIVKSNLNENCIENEEEKFIWGILSNIELASNLPNLFTMNDIDLIYLKKENKYILSVETLISFDNGYQGEKQHLEYLLEEFTAWMINNGYSVNSHLDLYSMFTEGYNITTHFNSIEDAYRTFSILVRGY